LEIRVKISHFGLLCLLLAACTSESGPDRARMDGFLLELGSGFTRSEMSLGEEGRRIDYLSGDEAGKPRLTVRILPRELSLEGHFDENYARWSSSQILEEKNARGLELINAVGMGQELEVQPFPLDYPDLQLRVDMRVFFFDEQAWCFTWTQDPSNEAAWQSYQLAIDKLRFLDETDKAARP
jgi:hypothetical protein